MAAPIPNVAATLNLTNPTTYSRFDLKVMMSSASCDLAKKLIGTAPLYSFLFALPTAIEKDGWTKLLVECNIDGGAWQSTDTIIGPELSSRWSIFSFMTLVAASAGFPAGWTLHVGDDNSNKALTQEQSATMPSGAAFHWAQAPAAPADDNVGLEPTAGRAKLIELIQALKTDSINTVYLDLQGVDVKAMKAKNRNVARKEIAGLIPAHFRASASLEGVPRKKPATPSGACCLSGNSFSVEAAHVFDAGIPPKVILAILQALEERSPPSTQTAGKLFSRLKSDCNFNIAEAQGDETRLQSDEINIISLDVSLHQAFDRRARAAGQAQAVMLIDPLEGRTGMCAKTALPATYISSVVWREVLPSAIPSMTLPLASVLMGYCSGKEPWKTPSSMLLDFLVSKTVSPGLLSKSCENLFTTFATQGFKSKVDQITAKVVAYFADDHTRKRKTPGDRKDQDNDDDDDAQGGSSWPAPSRGRPLGGVRRRDGNQGGAGGSRSGASGTSGPTVPRSGRVSRPVQHAPTWSDFEALQTLLSAFAELRSLPVTVFAFEGLQSMAKSQQEPLLDSSLSQAWTQQSRLLADDSWSWALVTEMQHEKEAQSYRAAWLCLLGALNIGDFGV